MDARLEGVVDPFYFDELIKLAKLASSVWI